MARIDTDSRCAAISKIPAVDQRIIIHIRGATAIKANGVAYHRTVGASGIGYRRRITSAIPYPSNNN